MTLLTLVHLQASFADHCHIHSTPVARHSWCSTHSAKAWHAILCLLGMQSVRCPQIETPLEEAEQLSDELGNTLLFKREDLQAVRAFTAAKQLPCAVSVHVKHHMKMLMLLAYGHLLLLLSLCSASKHTALVAVCLSGSAQIVLMHADLRLSAVYRARFFLSRCMAPSISWRS